MAASLKLVVGHLNDLDLVDDFVSGGMIAVTFASGSIVKMLLLLARLMLDVFL